MKRYFIPLVLLLTTISCQKKKNMPIVLSSNGNINTITVVMTNQLWAGTIGQAVRDMYAYPAEGLPQQEPLFDLKQIPPEVFSGFAQSSRSVLWVGIRIKPTFASTKTPMRNRRPWRFLPLQPPQHLQKSLFLNLMK